MGKGLVPEPHPNLPCPPPSPCKRYTIPAAQPGAPSLVGPRNKSWQCITQLSSPAAPCPSFSRLRHYGKGFMDHCCSSHPSCKALCLPFHPHRRGFIQCQLPPGRSEIKHTPEMPRIAGDQDVPGSRQPQKQNVAGLGWSHANSPPARGAGLSHGPAWTDGCREGHVDHKAAQKPSWWLCMLW